MGEPWLCVLPWGPGCPGPTLTGGAGMPWMVRLSGVTVRAQTVDTKLDWGKTGNQQQCTSSNHPPGCTPSHATQERAPIDWAKGFQVRDFRASIVKKNFVIMNFSTKILTLVFLF